MNGPPRGSNIVNDQSSYDLVFRDIIINSTLGTLNGNTTTYNLGTDSINQIYKAEIISATIKFNTAITTNVINQSIILSIPQLNNKTTTIAGNIVQGNSGQGNNSVQGAIFVQIPDNNTPLIIGANASNNIITLLIGPHMYESIQFYNPPINKLNTIDVAWFDQQSNPISISNSGSGTINTFYFTLRLYYFQKRYSGTAFSTSVYTTVGNGTYDTIFNPGNN
jgi:hypothetical protein